MTDDERLATMERLRKELEPKSQIVHVAMTFALVGVVVCGLFGISLAIGFGVGIACGVGVCVLAAGEEDSK